MDLRPLGVGDADAACALYLELTRSGRVAQPEQFSKVLSHPGTTVCGAFIGPSLAGMATLHLMPNMTYGGQPYGLIENVVTARRFQGQGVGRDVLTWLIDIAWAADAYKVMLLTGQARGAQGFYRKVGFDDSDKHGMVIRRS
ncbi:GNAT family N-acetyltransferase [uncultured Tateyamaria sp.]|uniref:GNAT family N-acetyltransferase n=1 Tax=uncultured Tateyamaria sp. TaxID=455651 RepID=UPI0026040CB9|nr:GNAT family N-acetyltransferase [uncultured Tateyamaria sp.]